MEISIKDLFGILFKRIVWIILATFICGGIVFVYTKFGMTKVYQSSTSLRVTYVREVNENDNVQTGTTTSTTDNNNMVYSLRELPNCIALISFNKYYKELSDNLVEKGYKISAGTLAKSITYTQRKDTSIIDVTVKYSDSETAYAIAKAISETAPTYVSDKYKASNNGIRLLDDVCLPTAGTSPISPNVKLFTVLGLIFGFFVSYIVFFAIERGDTRIKCSDDLKDIFEFPVLGVIPKIEIKSEESK